MRILRRGTRILRQLLQRIPAPRLDRLMVTTNEVDYLLELCRLAIEEGWSYGAKRQKRDKIRRRATHFRHRANKLTSTRHFGKPKS